MNKNELVKAIADKTDLKLSEIENFVNALIETISKELKKKGKVTLVGLGTLKVTHRKEKRGVNPKTGARITIKAKNVPKFSAGKALKRAVDGPGDGPG